MPTEVVTTRVTPDTDKPKIIEAVPPPPLEPLDADSAEVLRFVGIHVPAKPPVSAAPPVPPAPAPSSSPDPATPPGGAAPSSAPAPNPTTGVASPPSAPSPAEPVPTPGEPAAGPLSRLAAAADRLNQAADRLATPAPTPATPSPAKPEPEVDPETALRQEALRELSNSRKYRGRDLVSEYNRFSDELGSYRTRWMSENPGKRFDVNDGNHDEWLDVHEPDVDRDDLVRAETRIETLRETDRRVEERLRAIEEQRATEEAHRAAQEAPARFVEAFGKGDIDGIKATDPALAFAVKEALPTAARTVETVHAICRPGASVSPTDVHQQFVLGTVAFYELQLANLPPDQSNRDGRQFVPAKVYDQLTPTQRKATWTLRNEPAVVERLVLAQLQRQVTARADEYRGWFAAQAPAPTPAPTPATPPPAPAPVVPVAPPSPVTSSASSPVEKPESPATTMYFGR